MAADLPFDVDSFESHLRGSLDTMACDSNALPITQCKGSATTGVVSVSKRAACHSSGTHRTSDSYFIWQAADTYNINVLMEIGQGDVNHPIGIRPDYASNGWFNGCSRPRRLFPLSDRLNLCFGS